MTIDLRNFQDMPLEVARVRDSDLRRRSTGDEFKAAIILWCAAWHQVPAGSLPNDDVELADLAAFGTSKGAVKDFLKVKKMAMRGWTLCADANAPEGRWYHPRLAAKVLIAWRAKEANRERTLKARLASLAKALSQEKDPTRLAILRLEHEKLLTELSHPLSQGSSHAQSTPPVTPTKGSDQEGSDQIGRDNSLSSSPPSPSAQTRATTGDDDASQGQDPPRAPEEPIPRERLSRKAQGLSTAALRIAVNSGNVLDLVKVFNVTPGFDPDWTRETDSLAIGEVISVFLWCRYRKDQIRMPTGFRHALAAWRDIGLPTRREMALSLLAEAGVDVDLGTEVEVGRVGA